MPALKQPDSLNSYKKRYRAVAYEMAVQNLKNGSIKAVDNVRGMAVQRKPVVQKKPGEDEELPVQRKIFNAGVNTSLQAFNPIQKKENKTGLPDGLKNGMESASGFDLNDVRVHYNSPEPAQLQAFAYAQGNNVHLAPGQEKHLPHEAWHVVQQKQGRVTPTTQLKGAGINDDAGLEAEADQMGDKIAKGNIQPQSLLSDHFANTGTVQQKVIQRLKTVPTDFGKFETTKFAEADGRGVEITLLFHPDKAKVDAKKIALSQSVKTTLANGNPYAIDPNTDARMVGAGKSGAGYYVDQLSDVNNPLYSQDAQLGAAATLKDTPQSGNKGADATELGVNTNYDLGYCYKVNPADVNKTDKAAGLWDKPQSGKQKGRSKIFETTALATDGADKDKYYGSVSWGYKMEGTDAAPTVTLMDIASASMGTPTANFTEPAKLWNSAKTRGTLKVTADPATVLKGAGVGTETLAKNTKLKQLSTAAWGSDPSVNAEVLKADGTGSGKIIYIKNVDVADVGDGAPTKSLPIP